jgi:hypothetical protein
LDRRLGGPQSRSRRGGEEKNSQPLPGFEPQIIQPVAQRCTTKLSRVLLLVEVQDKSQNLLTGKKSFENVAKFKYLGKILTNQNYIRNETETHFAENA